MTHRRWAKIALALAVLALAGGANWAGAATAPATRDDPPAAAPAERPEAAAPGGRVITPAKAVILGIVEGLTEYLPISSTGHLILAGHFLGLDEPATKQGVDAFEVVIQVGAVLAVLGLYRRRVGQMALGVVGRSDAGLRLFILLLVAFLPAALLGVLAHGWIKSRLFAPGPVVAALAVGGVLMILVEKWRKRSLWSRVRTIDTMNVRMALLIGLAQCAAMWPGTSRSMVTIVAGILVGLEVKAAAEFSFLLALPTLGGASFYDFLKSHQVLGEAAGATGIVIGLAVSWIVAVIAVRAFVSYLNRRGLEPFGYYRIVLAAVLLAMFATGRLAL